MIKHDKIESKSSRKLKWINFDVLLGKFLLCVFFAEFFCKLQSRNDFLWFLKIGNGFLVWIEDFEYFFLWILRNRREWLFGSELVLAFCVFLQMFLRDWFGVVEDVAFEAEEDLAFWFFGGFLDFCNLRVEIVWLHFLDFDFRGCVFFGSLRVLRGVWEVVVLDDFEDIAEFGEFGFGRFWGLAVDEGVLSLEGVLKLGPMEWCGVLSVLLIGRFDGPVTGSRLKRLKLKSVSGEGVLEVLLKEVLQWELILGGTWVVIDMVLRGCRFLGIEFLVMKGLTEGDRGLKFVSSGEGEFGTEHIRVNFVSHQEYQNFQD